MHTTEKLEKVIIAYNPFLRQWTVDREEEREKDGVDDVCEKMKLAAV